MRSKFNVALGIALLFTLFVVSIASAIPLFNHFIRISKTDTLNENSPKIAYSADSDTYLVVYQESVNTPHVYMRMYDSVGNPLSIAPYDFGLGTYAPEVVYNSLDDLFGVLLVYDNESNNTYDVMLYWVDGGSQSLADPGSYVELHSTGDPIYNTAIAYNNNPSQSPVYHGFMAVWEEGPLGNMSIHGRLAESKSPYTTKGAVWDIAVPANGNIAYSQPDITYNLNMNEFLIVYVYENSDTNTHSTGADIYGRRFINTGVAQLSAEILIETWYCDQYRPTVAAYRLNQTLSYFIAYEDDWVTNDPTVTCDSVPSIRGIYLEQDGTLPNPANYKNVRATLSVFEGYPDIVADERTGTYTIVYSRTENGYLEVNAQLIDATDETIFKIDQPTIVSRTTADADYASSYHPTVAVGNVTRFITWYVDNYAGTGFWEIVGRLSGYQNFMPLVSH